MGQVQKTKEKKKPEVYENYSFEKEKNNNNKKKLMAH